MSCDCGCCAGARVTTPVAEENRPGLSAIAHRPGRYATFRETMLARLSSADFPELAELRSRSASDASIALCDTWAIAAEVLSFYQDRIANEGYLRTATERRSLLELGRLTGYAMRPGVSASVYLAYEIDPNAQTAEIPVGTRAQSVPGPGEKMQTFETAEPLSARAAWSRIKVRQGQPQWREPPPVDGAERKFGDAHDVLKRGVYVQGADTKLKPNDAILIDYGAMRVPYRIDTVTVSDDQQSTRLDVREWNTPASSHVAAARASRRVRAASASAVARSAVEIPPGQRQAASIAGLVGELTQSLTVQPRNALTVQRDATTTLRAGGDVYSRLLIQKTPALASTLYAALQSASIAQPSITPIKVYALRTKAALFGNNAPNRVVTAITGGANPSVSYNHLSLLRAWRDMPEFAPGVQGERKLSHVPLDAAYEQIKAGDGVTPSYLVLDLGADDIEGSEGGAWPRVLTIADATTLTLSIGVAMSTRVTQLEVNEDWLTYPIPSGQTGPRTRAVITDPEFPRDVELLRRTQVYAQSELLTLAADPQTEPVAGDVSANEIELDAFYDGLKVGQWLIAAGERDLDDDDAKVNVAERGMIAAVRHGLSRLVPTTDDGTTQSADLPGDTLHTFIKLAAPLAYRYRRAAFTLYGNVVRATHGETRRETLGAGDATRILQTFALRSPPLTYVAAPTPDGIDSTLKVRVQNLLWTEVDSLVGAGPDDRVYLSRRDDSEATRIVFGDGGEGARLPTGQDNVAAVYRSGIGSAGNVRAGQITLPTDKPLGVKGVDNPIRSSGGADPDTLELARVNEPLAVTALDRLVGVQDYADFSRTFAGIGKAIATTLHDGHESLVQVTIAGIDDAPIDATSDLYLNLVAALHAFGDPHLAISVDVREALSLVIQAKVAIKPEYAWEDVQPRVAAALYARFGFQARELGQAVIGSEIVGVIAAVDGVAHVLGLSFKLFDYDDLVAGLAPTAPSAPTPGISETPAPLPATAAAGTASTWLAVASARIGDDGKIAPAQIAYLSADVPDTLLLELAP